MQIRCIFILKGKGDNKNLAKNAQKSYNKKMDNLSKKLEEGGIFAAFGDKDAPKNIYYGLLALQHRGQTSCGVVLSKDFRLSSVKGSGLVAEIIRPNLNRLIGNMGIGHIRYGSDDNAQLYAQPLVSNYLKGNISIAIAGKITNSQQLKAELEDQGAIFQLGTDAEVLANLCARKRTKTNSIENAVLKVMDKLEGSFAVCLMSSSKLLAFRDKEGRTPLCIGQKNGSYYFASEDTAFSAIGANFLQDVAPGELVLLTSSGITSFNSNDSYAKPCIYEYLYFARPDSIIDGISVYSVRVKAGRELYKSCPASGDLVVGVPYAGLHYALGYAAESGIPYGDGLFRNHYLGRTGSRDENYKQNSVSIKLNVIKAAVKDKDIILVDDSMHKGITAKRIVSLLKAGGAKSVHLRVACPRFLQNCPFYSGIDAKLKNYNVKQIQKEINADSLMFLPIEQLSSIGVPKDCCKKCFLP